MIGKTLGHYKIVKKIGSGGMGEVYKARDLHLDRFVALKILPAEKVADPDRKRRFVQEAKAASALNHPNIIHIYDIASEAGVDFIAMEYVEGKTLREGIGRRGLPLKDTLKHAIQIADALAKAHSAGIVHRDLKPSNIMVNEDDTVKILDFGLAKLTEKVTAGEFASTATVEAGEKPVTQKGVIVGTVAYLSPEQAEGKEVDPRSDIFSFGSVLYEMIAGCRAFQGDSKISTISAVLNKEPAPLSSEIPHDLEKTITRCLRKDPARRWQTMSDLKVALEDLKEESESGKLSAVTPIAPRRNRRMWLFAAAALVLVIAVSAVVWRFSYKGAAPAFETERLTFETGLVACPAISPDGKLLVYASDREGPLNLYLQQLGGRQSIQLTNHEAWDWFPDFSPDGSRIVFRSDRDGGGIYEVDTLGGGERRIADHGYLPRFSPDGSTIAYVIASALVRTGKMYLISAKGGVPRPFQPAFSMARFGPPWHSPAVWSPDGRYILFDGSRDGDPKSRDWWIAPVAGGDPTQAMAPALAERSVIRFTFAWRGEYVYWSEGTTVGGISIYRISISGPPWKVTGVPERITSPLGMQLATSISANGCLVFSSWTPSVNLWSWPLRANETAVSGEGRQITYDSSYKPFLDVAANGSKLAYAAANRPDQGYDLRVRDIANGHEEVIASTAALVYWPRLSADGSRLAWSDVAEGNRVAYLSEPDAAYPRQVCRNCLLHDFFTPPTEALIAYGSQLVRQNLTTGARTPLLDITGSALIQAALSPGDRWVACVVARPDGMAALYIVPVGKQVPRDAWVQIAEDRNYLGSPSWSPDGKLIYYMSSRDDRYCVWAQRITAEGQPDGAPVGTLHMHGPIQSSLYGGASFGITSDRLYILLPDVRGNAWMVNVDQ